ncbi:MAG: DUF885 family protein [Pseudomonadota bacterium]
MPQRAGEPPQPEPRDALLQLCPEMALVLGAAVPEAARLARTGAAREQVRELLTGWQQDLRQESRTPAEEREPALIQGFLALTDLVAAQEAEGARDPDILRRTWRLLLHQREHGDEAWLQLLRTLPGTLEDFRRQPLRAQPSLLEDARQVAAELPQALQALRAQSAEAASGAPQGGEIEKALATFHEALQAHQVWLGGLEAHPGTGSEADFDVLSQHRQLPYASAELGELLETEQHEWEVECARLARRIDRGRAVDVVLAAIHAMQSASAQSGFAGLRSALSAVHAHAEERGLAAIGKSLRSVELEVLPSAVAGMLDDVWPWLRVRGAGFAILSVVESSGAVPLSGFAAAELSNLAARIGVPGSALLQFSARQQRSGVRAGLPEDAWPWGYTGWASDLSGGWPLYVVEMLREEGWDGSLEHALLLAENALRAVRAARLDLNLARGVLDDGAARQQAMAVLGLDERAAHVRVVRWARRPGAQVAAVVGALRLFELRRDCKQLWGRGFSLQRFHQAVLAAGQVPLDEVATCLRELSPQERA